jgi:hypothetical protein
MNDFPALKRAKTTVEQLPDYTPTMLAEQLFKENFQPIDGESLESLSRRVADNALTAQERMLSLRSAFVAGEEVNPFNNEMWLKTERGYLHITLTDYKYHKYSILHPKTWRQLGAAKGGMTLAFTTQAQYECSATVSLSVPDKSLLNLHMDSKGKLLEVQWLQGGKDFPGKVTRSVAQFFIHLLKPERAYLYDLAKRVDGLPLSLYLPFVKNDSAVFGGPGWYGEIGFAIANVWDFAIKNANGSPRLDHQSRDLYYDAVLWLRGQTLTQVADVMQRKGVGERFVTLSRLIHGSDWEARTFFDLMKTLYVKMFQDPASRDSFEWLCKEFLASKDFSEVPEDDVVLCVHNQWVAVLENSLHYIFDWKDHSLSSYRPSHQGIDRKKTWEEEVRSRLPKPMPKFS